MEEVRVKGARGEEEAKHMWGSGEGVAKERLCSAVIIGGELQDQQRI